MDRSGTKYSDTLEVLHNLKCHHEITAGEKNCLFFFFFLNKFCFALRAKQNVGLVGTVHVHKRFVGECTVAKGTWKLESDS